MDELKSFDLAAYMSNAIRNIMKKAYKNVLQNPREARFALRMHPFRASRGNRKNDGDKLKERHNPHTVNMIKTINKIIKCINYSPA